MNSYHAALDWQSRAVARRHLTVFLRNWHTSALPPILEPVVLLLAFGLGLGAYIPAMVWAGEPIDYLTYLAPGMMAYTAFMTAFFQALFAAFIRMHYQKTWESQLTTQIRLEHVVWGEAIWAATMSTIYVIIVALVLGVFDGAGWIALHWTHVVLAVPFVFYAALAFAALGLLFTAIVPDIDHMNIPFFVVILPLGFASSTYFPLQGDSVWIHIWLGWNPLHHVAEGLRFLTVRGEWTGHLPLALLLLTSMLAVLIPVDLRLLRRRVLGEG